EFFRDVAANLIGEENIVTIKEPTMVGEDMAYYLQEVPGTFFFLGEAPQGEAYPHHHPKFDVDEGVLWKGSALFAAAALKWLKDNALIPYRM
ncbi:MAG TPA: amidohydrolase, partial [Firmicutes bacterium]|nr:amidohydrolase [Bacillota bacterium]